MDRLSLAVIVTALMLLVFSSALLVGRSQSPVALIERPEKAKGGRPRTSASKIGQTAAKIKSIADTAGFEASASLHLRKTNLVRLLGGASMDLRLGLRVGEVGPDLFRHTCRMGTRRHGLEAQGSPLLRGRSFCGTWE
jgi:hypothetical protein